MLRTFVRETTKAADESVVRVVCGESEQRAGSREFQSRSPEGLPAVFRATFAAARPRAAQMKSRTGWFIGQDEDSSSPSSTAAGERSDG